MGHSTIIVGVTQIVIVRVKIQIPVKVQPRQTPKR